MTEVDELKRVKHELEERKRLYQQQVIFSKREFSVFLFDHRINLFQIAETRNQYEYLHRQTLPDRQLPPTISVK